MRIRNLFMATSLVLAAVAARAQAPPKAAVLKADPVHSVVEFSVRHLVSKVTGNFTA